MRNFRSSIFLVLFILVGSCSSTAPSHYSQSREGFDEFDEEVILGPRSEAMSLDEFLEEEESAEGEAISSGEDEVNTEMPQQKVTPKRDLRFEINKIIADHRFEFKHCYDQNGKDAKGQITMVFRIRSDGKVQRAGIVTSELPMGLKACLVEKFYQIQFPQFRAGKSIDVKQPLNF